MTQTRLTVIDSSGYDFMNSFVPSQMNRRAFLAATKMGLASLRDERSARAGISARKPANSRNIPGRPRNLLEEGRSPMELSG
jgi:hypothetical protein